MEISEVRNSSTFVRSDIIPPYFVTRYFLGI
jgi:hypothetical protein